MSKSESYVSALEEKGLFVSSGHKTRFKELVDCYGSYPFFTKGLCKCMYLSAWDEEHFAMILQVLSDLAIGRERNTEEMRLQGEALAGQQKGGDFYVFQLSNAFLDGERCVLKGDEDISEQIRYIIRQALRAEQVIDCVEGEKETR